MRRFSVKFIDDKKIVSALVRHRIFDANHSSIAIMRKNWGKRKERKITLIDAGILLQ